MAILQSIDVILLDMTIPGASSQDIVAEAAKTILNVRIILPSASSQGAIADVMSPGL